MPKYVCYGCEFDDPCVLEIAMDYTTVLNTCPFGGGPAFWNKVDEDTLGNVSKELELKGELWEQEGGAMKEDIIMIANLSAIQADIDVLKICVEGMKADNGLRALNGEPPAWGAGAFFDAQREMKRLAEKIRAEVKENKWSHTVSANTK